MIRSIVLPGLFLLCIFFTGALASLGGAVALSSSAPIDDGEECGDRKVCKPHQAHDSAELGRLAPDMEPEDVETGLRALLCLDVEDEQ